MATEFELGLAPIAAYKPRYVKIEDVWYIRRDHYAEQLKAAIESAFTDGVRFAAAPPPVVRVRRKTGANHDHKMVEEIVPQ